MWVFLGRRVLVAVAAVVTVSFGAFVAFGLSFDPTGQMRLSPDPRPRQLLLHYYHLSDPILLRYWYWAKSVFTDGFGRTISLDVSGSPPHLNSLGEPIGPAIWHSAGVTAQLVAFALVITAVASIALGTLSAARRRTWVDVSTRAFTYVAAALPAFLVADFLVRSVISAHHWWFEIGPPTGGVSGWFRHMTLPAIALSVGLVGAYTRYVRSSMMVSLTEPYTTVARGKGLPERQVVFRHALRNSLIPVTALLSLEVGAVIGASLVADAVFHVGGLASSFLFALGQSDPFQLTALVVTMAIVVSVFLLVADVLVVVLDPRTRH